MLKPFEWKDKPAIIEHLFPVQKISAESYKEQMAGAGKTLTALGSYWKGRKPLILNKACILGSLLPVTDDRLLMASSPRFPNFTVCLLVLLNRVKPLKHV